MIQKTSIFIFIICSALILWESKVSASQENPENSLIEFMRTDTTFTSKGQRCGAWLYLPLGIKNPPVVVMAHGFGGQRWMRLPAYAKHFAENGIAVFSFDYRGFNDSEGTPRNYINPKKHLEDWEAAIAHVRTLKEIDPNRIALWGTSFSGGHAIVSASKDSGISAVIAQVPFTDGMTTTLSYLSTPIFAFKALYHGIGDVVLHLFTGKRHYIKIAGKPGEDFAMMSKEDTMPGLLKLLGPKGTEETFMPHNKCPADIAIKIAFYRPVRHADKVKCPALVIGAENDSLFPPDGPLKLTRKMKNVTYVSLPMGHFDPYVGKPFKQLVVQMCDFLKESFDPKTL